MAWDRIIRRARHVVRRNRRPLLDPSLTAHLRIEKLEDRALLSIDAALVEDFVTTAAGSSPRDFVDVGGLLFFTADDGVHGRELWKSDGTSSGTMLVKDIRADTASTSPEEMTALGSQLVFTDYDGFGDSLWISDGTPDGTRVLADVNARYLTVVGETLFFRGASGDSGDQLWRSDGTPLGTHLVREALSGSDLLSPSNLTNVDGTLFFTAYDVASRRRLWKSDGTSAGTSLVSGITPGPNGADTEHLSAVGGKLFFVVNQPTTGRELWVSDGTSSGTHRVYEIAPSNYDWQENAIVDLNGTAFFIADDGEHGHELWSSDGTCAGTQMVVDIHPSGSAFSNPDELTRAGALLYFAANDGVVGRTLWRSDGTATGTIRLVDSSVDPGGSYNDRIAVAGDRVFFSSESQLWVTDGTSGGTQPVETPAIGAPPSIFHNLTAVGDDVFLSAWSDSTGSELFRIDGSASSPQALLVSDIGVGNSGSYFVSVNEVQGSLIYSTYYGIGEFNDAIGSQLLADGLFAPEGVVDFNGVVYFLACRISDFYCGMWRVNEASGGAELIHGWDPITSIEGIRYLKNVAGTLFFKRMDAEHGLEIWKSDGTCSGTEIIKDINPGSGNSLMPDWIYHPRDHWFNIGSTMYFPANDGTNGYALWKTDGTCSGTRMVRDINSSTQRSYELLPGYFTEVQGILFFVAYDVEHGQELWVTDGTSSGTQLVRDLAPGPDDADPRHLTNVGGQLFFTAYDADHGQELWVTDGTCSGTRLVRDLQPGPAGAFPLSLTNVGGTLFFATKTDPYGGELWKSDGTCSGTVLVRDIRSGWLGSNPEQLTVVGDRLFFTAKDREHGRELWTSDGTLEGTVVVTDVNPGPFGSDPEKLTVVGDQLYFTANEPAHGRELWRAVIDAPVASAGNLVELPTIAVPVASAVPASISQPPAVELTANPENLATLPSIGALPPAALHGRAVDVVLTGQDLRWVVWRIAQEFFRDEHPGNHSRRTPPSAARAAW